MRHGRLRVSARRGHSGCDFDLNKLMNRDTNIWIHRVVPKHTAAKLALYLCIALLSFGVEGSAQNQQKQIQTTRFVTSDHTLVWWPGHTPLGRVGVWTVTDYSALPNKKTHVFFLGPLGHVSVSSGSVGASVGWVSYFLGALVVCILIVSLRRRKGAVERHAY